MSTGSAGKDEAGPAMVARPTPPTIGALREQALDFARAHGRAGRAVDERGLVYFVGRYLVAMGLWNANVPHPLDEER